MIKVIKVDKTINSCDLCEPEKIIEGKYACVTCQKCICEEHARYDENLNYFDLS